MENHEDQGLDYSDMIASMTVDTWPLAGRDIVRDGRYARATLLCTVVHEHGIVTYMVEVGGKVVHQHTDYVLTLKFFKDL